MAMFPNALGISLIALVLIGPAQADQKPPMKYPRLHAALHELREARTELKGSKMDYGDRKKKALTAIENSITSLKVILAIKGDDWRGIARDRDYYKKYKNHPHLRAALENLLDAREELKSTKADFQGNRKRALEDINSAIDHIKDLLDAVK
jgi:hypothetical protein